MLVSSALFSPLVLPLVLPPLHHATPLGLGPRAPSVCLQLRDEEGSLDDADDAFLDDLDAALRAAAAGDRPGRLRQRGPPPPPQQRDRVPAALARPLDAWQQLLSELKREFAGGTPSATQTLTLGTLSLLVGFWVAQGLTPGVVGQGGFWEYNAGLVAVFIVERITDEYYKRPMRERTTTMRLLHAFKVGFFWGCVLDAIKYAG